MAFSATTLFKVAGAEPALWMYSSADAGTAIVGSGYFNDATDNLKNGDIIMCARTGTVQVGPIVVTSATGAAVVTTVGTELVVA